MDHKTIFNFCKKLGCCDACGIRYLGIRSPNAYEKLKEYVLKYQDPPGEDTDNTPVTIEHTNGAEDSNGNGESPPMKRRRVDACVSCLGVLQEDVWQECNQKVKEVLDKKQYECSNFACALSAPIATILREKAMLLRLKNPFADYDCNVLTPLKEAWKWSFGIQLATFIGKSLDSGAVSPLLITLTMEYPDDLQELEVLKTLSPDLFESRSKQRRRFAVEFTRRSAEQALETVSLEALSSLPGWEGGLPAAGRGLGCVSVVCTRAPLYLGGRYIKRSRELPQTPWLVNGRRMMQSSVQEIIFGPLARGCGMSEAEAEHRLKFMSAGREDVDVRCLGDGRPFAVEILDAKRQLTDEELDRVCVEISAGGQVAVTRMVYVTREDLTDLKKGEETKCKTYEALCIKLTHSEYEQKDSSSPIAVTEEDIRRLNSYSNSSSPSVRVELSQKTPIRVLHRRPLLQRSRQIIDMTAHRLPDHPQLFVLQLQTSAGAYVKEAIHGEFGRSQPAIGAAIGAKLDILALDVAKVHLTWPDK